MIRFAAPISMFLVASQSIASIPETSFCVEADGRLYDVVTRVADDQVYGRTDGIRPKSRLVFAVCSADPAAIWISNADRRNSALSAEAILERAAASDKPVTMRALNRQLIDNGYTSFVKGYRADGCLCSPDTLAQAFEPASLREKLIEEDQK